MNERLHVEREIGHHGHITQLNAALFGQHLPRDDVRVMFHFRENDGVAFVEVGSSPSVGHEVDGFGGAAGDDHLVRVEALLEFGAAGFVAFRRFPGEGVNGPVNVGVGFRIVGVHRIDNDLWFLRGGGVVEVDQPVAVDLALQNGKLFTKGHALTASIRIPGEPLTEFASHPQGNGC